MKTTRPWPRFLRAVRNLVIVDRITRGETLQAVGTDYGITRERVRQIVLMAGIKVGIRHSTVIDSMVTTYQAGESLDTIAERLGYLYRDARSALQGRGIAVPPKPPYRKYLNTPHGTAYGYVYYQCRCDECVAAIRAARIAQKKDRHARVGTLPSEKHGNYSTYLNWGCRCQPCRKAFQIHNKPYSAAWRARNRDKINAQRRAKWARHAIDNATKPQVESE